MVIQCYHINVDVEIHIYCAYAVVHDYMIAVVCGLGSLL